MSNQSIIEHRGNYYYVEFREDYLILSLNCKYRKPDTEKSKSKGSPYCKALILAILEGWTNEKRDNKKSLAVFMTYPQWIDSLFGMFGRNVVIDSIDELLGEGLITREPYKMFGKDTWQYYLCYQEVNKRLKELPEREPHERLPKVSWSHPSEDAVTNKRDDLPFTNKRVAVTNKRQTRLQVTDDPFTSNHNIESTNNHNIETDIEESIPEQSQTPNSSPNGDMLSLFEEMRKRLDTLEAENQSLRAELSTKQVELPTGNTQDNQAGIQAKEQTSEHPIASETTQLEQSALFTIERPKQPQMPPVNMSWSAEKMVQITEAKRICRNKPGAYFSEELPGKSKKTQRQRQLDAAKKIIDLGITEEKYIMAYDDRNDAWWNESEGSLTVEDMLGKTKKGNIRIIEVLERLESRSSGNTRTQSTNIRQFPASQPRKTANRSMDEQASIEEMTNRMLDEEVQAQQLARLHERAAAKRAAREQREMALAK